MDDYGTGSASSSVLLQTPMDEIKIDMSFIRGITDNQTKQALVRSMVDFANKADLKSCLEGVEDEKAAELSAFLWSHMVSGVLLFQTGSGSCNAKNC